MSWPTSLRGGKGTQILDSKRSPLRIPADDFERVTPPPRAFVMSVAWTAPPSPLRCRALCWQCRCARPGPLHTQTPVDCPPSLHLQLCLCSHRISLFKGKGCVQVPSVTSAWRTRGPGQWVNVRGVRLSSPLITGRGGIWEKAFGGVNAFCAGGSSSEICKLALASTTSPQKERADLAGRGR